MSHHKEYNTDFAMNVSALLISSFDYHGSLIANQASRFAFFS
jgi:hypothetical protein